MARYQSTIAFVAATLAIAAIGAAPARAEWPERTVTIVVPFPAGGSTDLIARTIGQKLQEKFGKPFVVENRSGATGAVGAAAVARSAPDGYTLLVGSIAVYAVNPFLQPNIQYDPVKDFDLITVAVRAANVLVTQPKNPANSVADVLAALKKNPGKVSFATSGAGSSDHLTAALFWQRSGTEGLHVPYRGGAPAVSDLIAGHVNFSFQNTTTVITQVRGGTLKALAVTGEKRQPLYPDVPTLTEAGVTGADVFSWQAMAAPKGLPADVKAKLSAAVIEALNAPDVRPKLEEMAFEIVANTPAQFDAFLAQELARWKKVIEVGKITAE